eukprot:scaffold43903_cov40-Phaeocystis_antarctica.AAC.1
MEMSSTWVRHARAPDRPGWGWGWGWARATRGRAARRPRTPRWVRVRVRVRVSHRTPRCPRQGSHAVQALSGIPRRPLEVARGPYWRATARRPRVTHGAVQLRVCRLGRPVLPGKRDRVRVRVGARGLELCRFPPKARGGGASIDGRSAKASRSVSGASRVAASSAVGILSRCWHSRG